MLTLIQFPWSPFCISIRRILERHKIPHRVQNVPVSDRSLVIKLTRGRAYTVPCLVAGKTVVADFTDFGQEVARYLDEEFTLELFPAQQAGIQAILARYIENDLEAVGFKVNDSYVIPKLPLVERGLAIRHKERKFGRGCIQQWRADRVKLNAQFAALSKPLDNLLAATQFLVGDRPRFVDYDLYGVLTNYLYNGKTRLPALPHLRRWYAAM